MLRLFFVALMCCASSASFGNTESIHDIIRQSEEIFNATRIVCSGISDEISKVSNVSKANTAVTVAGTVAAGGAMAAGIKKSQEDKEIDALVQQICNAGGCSAEGVKAMSRDDFFHNVMIPMSQIAELQNKLNKSKKLGNWRTGLLAGTIGTNVASAIISGLNTDQSDLIQHVEACNEMLGAVNDTITRLRLAGANPIEYPVVKQLNNIKTWCGQINVADVEKIEKRMKGVMGTSIAGAAIGGVGTAVSAAANSDKYMDANNKLALSDTEKQTEKKLNTTANIMAGANIATGAVGTGLNISMISLTKKLMDSAARCEEVLQ